jgi:hypothetical protein
MSQGTNVPNLRPILNFAPRGKSWPPGAKLSPRSELCPLRVKFPREVKISVRPSILPNSRECSPLGKNHISKNCPLFYLGSMLSSQFSAISDNFRQKNWRFSQKPMLWSKFLHILALFWVKNTNFFADFFGENILKIITSAPWCGYGIAFYGIGLVRIDTSLNWCFCCQQVD